MTPTGPKPTSKLQATPPAETSKGSGAVEKASHFAWRPELAVGISEIDAQHQELFRRAGLFMESLRRQSRQEIGVLLSFLRFYAVTHFGAEEAWMRKARYPGTAEHEQQHDRFIKDVLALSEQHEKKGGPGLDPAQVSGWLERWLTEHVTQVDTAMARYLQASGVPLPKPEDPSAV